VNLGLLDAKLNVTPAGKMALSLYDEGNSAILAGYLISHYRVQICKFINSEKDFLIFASHLVKTWRVVLKGGPTLVSDPLISVSQEFLDLIERAQQEIQRITGITLIPSKEITSLYVVFPNFNGFTNTSYHQFDLRSLCAHFLKKIELFQNLAHLPFGDDAIHSMKLSMPK